MDERIYLKVKLKSLAEEARIIRKETKRTKLRSIKDGLYLHRTGIVRNEARHTLLAYGFLRGRTYHKIENKAKIEPSWDKVRKMVTKYGSHFQPWSENTDYDVYLKEKAVALQHLDETLKRFDEWVKQAKEERLCLLS